MIDKNEFKDIKTELENLEVQREKTIQTSREIIKLSKLIIYSIHRNNTSNTESLIQEIKSKIKSIKNNEPTASVAKQEYVEAITYYEIIKNKKLPTRKDLEVNTEDYLLGLADLTGELVRKAVNEAINNNFDEVQKLKNIVENLYGEFLQFNPRSSHLRKKIDSVRWNLQKLEELLLKRII
ncbi:hypothetical protein J4468_00900 [Candidatus Woesearchaeota archaeon]|nr:hypothetical protein [Candidatus Woesearchaeota archaeon]